MKRFLFILAAFTFFAAGSVMAQSTATKSSCSGAKKAACAKTCASKAKTAQVQDGDVKLVANEGYDLSTCPMSGTQYATKTCSKSGGITTFAVNKEGKVTKTYTCGASGKQTVTEDPADVPSFLVEGESVEKEAKSSDSAAMPGTAKKACSSKSAKSCAKTCGSKAKKTVEQ